MKLKVTHRDITGKKLNNLRKEGVIPCIVYGRHLEKNIMLSCIKNDFLKLYKKAGYSTPITLSGDGMEQMALIYDIQLEPVTDVVLHVDFLAINKDEKVTTEVPLILEGLSEVEKLGLGKIQMLKNSIEVEALPQDLPHDIKVDISVITTINDVIFVKDLKVHKDVKVLEDMEQPVITVMPLQDLTVEEEKPATEATTDATATTDNKDAKDTKTTEKK